MNEPLYWTLENVFSAEVEIYLGNELAEISVDAEVPMRGRERQPRRGNRMYPTFIDLDLSMRDAPSKGFRVTLDAETARDLAMRLLEAATHADLIDLPDVDTCGHWFPCDCQQKLAGGASRRAPSEANR
jgi:hypothetical protein